MIVLMDLEWLEVDSARPSITQIAAMRVDAHWQEQEEYNAILRPIGLSQCDPSHMALNGYPPEAFQNGEAEADAMIRLSIWLREDDMIYVWHHFSQDTLKQAWQSAFHSDIPYPIVNARNRVHVATSSYKLYAVANALSVPIALPEHCARNDVAVMRGIFEKAKASQTRPNPVQEKNNPPIKVVTRAERNRSIIRRSQYHYLYTPESDVFHTRDCSLILCARDILGSVYYVTAAKNRRPCKICKPEIGARSPQRLQQTKGQSRKPEGNSIVNKEIIAARMLGGKTIELYNTNIVGYCHNMIHPGNLNKALLKEHDCLGKQCRFFQKNEEAPYWAALEQKRQARAKVKQQRKEEKARLHGRDEAQIMLRDEFQRFADLTDSGMDVIRVECPKPNICTVFYVSDNRFADGNRFPAFLDMVRQNHPRCRISLRHIMDLDNHFMTRDEYRALRR